MFFQNIDTVHIMLVQLNEYDMTDATSLNLLYLGFKYVH
jgi:hypothetical protein